MVSVHQLEKCISRRTFEKTWFSTRKQKKGETTGLAFKKTKEQRQQGKKGENLVEHKMEDDGEEGSDDDRTTDGTEEQL